MELLIVEFDDKVYAIFFAIHRNFSLLSFGDEAEEDEEEIAVVSKVRVDLNAVFLMIIPSLSPSFRTRRSKVAMTC